MERGKESGGERKLAGLLEGGRREQKRASEVERIKWRDKKGK